MSVESWWSNSLFAGSTSKTFGLGWIRISLALFALDLAKEDKTQEVRKAIMKILECRKESKTNFNSRNPPQRPAS